MRFLTSILLVLAFALAAWAEPNVKQVVFSGLSTASGGVKTSSVINATKFKNKTFVVNGVTSAGAFKNMSGTVLMQCAPTTNGPWSTCIANDYAQTAISRTTSGLFSWNDVTSYVRLHWTGATVKTWLKAWLNLSE